MVKNSCANVGNADLIPGSRRFPRGGNGNPLQCAYLENPMDRGAWCATFHWVAKSQTRLGTHALIFIIFKTLILKKNQMHCGVLDGSWNIHRH